MRIVFIRHAEKEKIGEDPWLTEKGAKQADHIAKRLEKEKFDEFYCSNLNRSKQTAEIISKILDMAPRVERSLNEFKSETIKKDRDQWNKDEKDHYTLLISFLKKLTKDPNENKTVLIVGHGITNRIILSHFLDLNINRVIQFLQKETGVNTLNWIEEYKNWRLEGWNDNHHVPVKLR